MVAIKVRTCVHQELLISCLDPILSHSRHCHRDLPWHPSFLTNKHDQFNLRHTPHWDVCSWQSVVLAFLAGLTSQQSRSCAETRHDIHPRTYNSISTGNVRYYLQWVGSRPVGSNYICGFVVAPIKFRRLLTRCSLETPRFSGTCCTWMAPVLHAHVQRTSLFATPPR